MKDTITKKVQDCLRKIEDFARAISLDEANISAGSVALTMADEIMSYSAKAYDLLEE